MLMVNGSTGAVIDAEGELAERLFAFGYQPAKAEAAEQMDGGEPTTKPKAKAKPKTK